MAKTLCLGICFDKTNQYCVFKCLNAYLSTVIFVFLSLKFPRDRHRMVPPKSKAPVFGVSYLYLPFLSVLVTEGSDLLMTLSLETTPHVWYIFGDGHSSFRTEYCGSSIFLRSVWSHPPQKKNPGDWQQQTGNRPARH